jgi:hypothetical protein
MKKSTGTEIAFGLLALGLIYFVITSNASITGFVISSSSEVSLVSPAPNTQTASPMITFIYSYRDTYNVKECSLIINNNLVAVANAMLSPYNNRITAELVTGSYDWRVECLTTEGTKISSETRRVVIGEIKNPDLRITKMPRRPGNLYEFQLKEGLVLNLQNLIPNDVIKVKQGLNTYSLDVLRVSQDYSRGIEYVDMITTPASKRIRLNQYQSVNIDFNNDGADDLQLTLDDISYNKAFMTARVVATAKQAAAAGPSGYLFKSSSGAETGTTGLVEIFLIGAVIVMILSVLITWKSHWNEKKYLTNLKVKAKTTPTKVWTTKAKPAKKKSRKKK